MFIFGFVVAKTFYLRLLEATIVVVAIIAFAVVAKLSASASANQI